jgi:thioredoxin 1
MSISRILITFAIVAAGGIFSLQAQQNSTPDGSKECVRHSNPAAAATNPAAVKTVVPESKPAAAPTRKILFFMNPNGRPCQMQLSIIDGMKAKLSSLAAVTYIKTTEAADQDKFGAYGIRGLPSLIILDQSGKELKRFTPGIQDEATILSALKESTK